MPILTKAQLEALNQSSFADNTTGAITPEILRTYNTATIETLVDSLDTGSFVQDLTSLDLYTASNDDKWDTIGSQSGSWITESETGSFARTDVSNTFNASQTIVGAVTASTALISGLHYPTADNGAKSFVQTDGNGNLSLQYVQSVYETIRNMSGVALDKGTPVYISGSTGDNGNAYIADATDDTKMPATYIVGEDLAINAVGLALVGGKIEGVNTSGYPAGTEIYVAEGGGWSSSRPSGSASVVQKLGVVTKEGVGGQGIVINQLQAELPNIQTGYAWVGNGSNQPAAIPTSSFGGGGTIVGYATTGSNNFIGDQTITGSVNVSGGEHLFIRRSTAGAIQELRLGATDNENNFAFIVTGSDQNPGQQVWGINVGGGIWANSFDAGVVFNNYVTASVGLRIQDGGTFSAPLQQGYAWVGDSNNRTSLIPTSSFGGGAGFPYTGDAQITGSLEVSETITSQIFLNPQTLTGAQTVPVGYNGMLTGPVSNAGTIVIESGATLVII